MTHRTSYAYSRPAFLEPHTLRLRLREGDGVRLIEHDLTFDPKPVGVFPTLDIEGNHIHTVWFTGLTETLTIESRFIAECGPFNPHNYLIYPDKAARLPVEYETEDPSIIAAYRQRCSPQPAVTAFASGIAQEVNWETLPFLSAMCQRINEMCTHVIRLAGPPQPPGETLQSLTGACRDLAVLYIDACRAMGLAARFVSGYLLDPEDRDAHYLHAWAEVFLPGGGWRGYDPSHGLAANERYAAVAAGRLSREAAPVTGTYRGDRAEASMTSAITVTATVSAPA